MNNPLLSIITINYNNAEGLKNTIESVIAQKLDDYSKVEYIIVDGASTDGSVEIIESCTKDAKIAINWKSEPDSGIYNAMNKGIKKAKGKYLHMLNSGDYYCEENILSEVLGKLNNNPEFLLCAVNLIEPFGKIKTELRFPPNLFYGAMLHQGMIYQKSLHEKYGMYNENYRYASDYEFSVDALYKKDANIDTIYTPCVNFIVGGVGGCKKSMEELWDIQIKNGIKIKKKKNPLKMIVKAIIPYGLLALYHKVKEKNDR